jgi:TonB C terminal
MLKNTLLIAFVLLNNLQLCAVAMPICVDPVVPPRPALSPAVELDEWLYSVRRKISETWNKDSHQLPATCQCSCTFVVDDNCKITNVKLISSSGIKEIDESFLAAVRNTSLINEKLALHRAVEVEFVAGRGFQFECKFLPESVGTKR